MSASLQKIIVIVGPTASGKTALAVELAKRMNGEVVSADSRQVYRGLDLGTGKVTKREMRGVRHHLIDVASPRRVYTADTYVKAGRKAIADIARRGKVPIIAGGIGFYIDALVGAISLPNVPPNPLFRKSLEDKAAEELYTLLIEQDPRRAEEIDRHNPVRLVRALEIAHAIGTTPVPTLELLYEILWIGIDVPVEVLNEKIEKRLYARMKRGMLAEAKRLHEAGLSWKRMEDLGLEYRSMARLLNGALTEEAFYRGLTTEIRRYAKRQRMYWRRNKEIRWFAPEAIDKIKRVVREFVG